MPGIQQLLSKYSLTEIKTRGSHWPTGLWDYSNKSTRRFSCVSYQTTSKAFSSLYWHGSEKPKKRQTNTSQVPNPGPQRKQKTDPRLLCRTQIHAPQILTGPSNASTPYWPTIAPEHCWDIPPLPRFSASSE